MRMFCGLSRTVITHVDIENVFDKIIFHITSEKKCFRVCCFALHLVKVNKQTTHA